MLSEPQRGVEPAATTVPNMRQAAQKELEKATDGGVGAAVREFRPGGLGAQRHHRRAVCSLRGELVAFTSGWATLADAVMASLGSLLRLLAT